MISSQATSELSSTTTCISIFALLCSSVMYGENSLIIPWMHACFGSSFDSILVDGSTLRSRTRPSAIFCE
eukprot:255855-Prymnesium_polylepis.1